MRIDLIASLPHYRDHMLPIFEALPEELRGTIHPIREAQYPLGGRAAMVASWQDLREIRGRCPIIYVEHGAGQAYLGDEKTATLPGYSGGREQHSNVIGYIAPSRTVAARWAPTPAAAVGCPKMDKYHGLKPSLPESVVFVWHWPCVISPECMTTFPHYEAMLPEIVKRYQDQGFTVFGHAHPKWEGKLDERLFDAGVTVLSSDSLVFETCAIMICDNSSLGPEFLSLGRPVVWLNAPWYRRDVTHGGRFWDWTVGGAVIDEPEDLIRMNLWDLKYNSNDERVVNSVYAHVDGHASGRAAQFIVELIGER